MIGETEKAARDHPPITGRITAEIPEIGEAIKSVQAIRRGHAGDLSELGSPVHPAAVQLHPGR
jgi:hypothetical protein